MAELVDTLIEDSNWEQARLAQLAENACRATLVKLGLNPEGFEISLLGCDDARIAILNSDFRANSKPTNVLSWPSVDRSPDAPGEIPMLPAQNADAMPEELGDIAIAYETCKREAEQAGKPFADHVTHLIVHGTLHLLGYDHTTQEDAVIMEDLEAQILATMGLPDPYRDH